MNPTSYEFLPAPLRLIVVLHVVTLTLHFAAMNFLFGGVAVVLFGRFGGARGGSRWENPTVRRMIALFPSAMAATITFGVAPLLFLQLTFHRQVYSAAIVSGWFWLFIIVAAMLSYYLLYGAAFAGGGASKRRGVLLGLAFAGFLYISFTYSSIFSLAERPDLCRSLYAAHQSGLALNPDLGSYLFRWLHMVLGALTVGAFSVGVVGRDDPEAFRVARGFFLWGMVAAAAAGGIYMAGLGDALPALMHGAGIWFLTVAIVLSAGSLHFFFKRRFLPAGAMLFVSLLGMVVTRHLVRLARLAPSYDPASLPVKPQWSVFLIFLICFVAAAATLAWMLRVFFSKSR